MALKEQLENSGNWLFRWRSYLPLLMMGIALIDMRRFTYLDSNYNLNLYWEACCLIVSFARVVIRAAVDGCVPEGTSGRNTLGQEAASLNTTGMYSIVRHPLYLGNFFIWLGISMFMRHWYVSLICTFCFWLYYERIIFAEEEFLRRKFGREFEKWADNIPCFIPKLGKWKPPSMLFSWKKVLKDEYSGLFAIIVSFVFLDVLGTRIVLGKIKFYWEWQVLFWMGFSTYLTLRTMKKKGMLEPSNKAVKPSWRSTTIISRGNTDSGGPM